MTPVWPGHPGDWDSFDNVAMTTQGQVQNIDSGIIKLGDNGLHSFRFQVETVNDQGNTLYFFCSLNFTAII